MCPCATFSLVYFCLLCSNGPLFMLAFLYLSLLVLCTFLQDIDVTSANSATIIFGLNEYVKTLAYIVQPKETYTCPQIMLYILLQSLGKLS